MKRKTIKLEHFCLSQQYQFFRRGWVYSANHLDEKRALLLDRLLTQGQIRLNEMAHYLQIPLELQEKLIYQLVQTRHFSGYINWQEGILYSLVAEKLRAGSQCPNCGGELGLKGDIVECQHCGSEILQD